MKLGGRPGPGSLRRALRRGGAVALVALFAAFPGMARAEGAMLLTEPLEGRKVRLDGVPKEWPSKFTDLSRKLQGGRSAPAASGNVGYDARYVYVAMKVKDEKIVRTRGAGAGEDHAVLYLAFPKAAGGYTTYAVGLYPGEPGKLPGVVKLGGRTVAGASLVEAPMAGGFTFEAKIPWSAFREATRTRVGLRGALRYNDADRGGVVGAVVATSTARGGSALPPLPLEAEQGLHQALIGPKNLPDVPARQAVGNVAGGRLYEQVAVYSTYLTIVGPDFRAGKEFHFSELSVEDARAVNELRLVDFDGDGLDEIVLRLRIGKRARHREVLNVLKMGSDDVPYVALSHEVGIKTEDGELENEVKIKKAGSKASIEIVQGKSKGFDPDTYAEPLPGGETHAALLPWETTKSRTFELRGRTFQSADEESWEPKMKAKVASRAAPRGASGPPAPRPPSPDELLDRVYGLYRKDRGVGAKKPRFDFVTDVAGDTTPERVVVHDRDIVVFGKGFRAGSSYTFITVGVPEGKDIVNATARDVTGDGKAEIIVRGVLHAKASKALGGDVVQRYGLFIYQVQGDELTRVFAAETGRALGKNRIIGAVAFAPADKGFELELRPARAIGWTEQTYPFPIDQTAAGGLEPLQLPWAGSSKRYVYDGTRFSQR